MKTKIYALIVLIFSLICFSIFINKTTKEHEILQVHTPYKLAIDTNNNRIIDSNETFCIQGIESFSTSNYKELFKKYGHTYKLNEIDFINIGYLADDFARKNLLYKKARIKKTYKKTASCQYVTIFLENKVDYKKILANSGFGIISHKIFNIKKFKDNYESSKKLNLVVYNHKSEKYHKLDCEYAKLAHDKILIPIKQLPKEAKPCRFCHNNKNSKNYKKKKAKDSTKNTNTMIEIPPISISEGDVELYIMDFTHTLKPNSYCSTEACKALVKQIDNAQESIDIALYGYEDTPRVTEALRNAKGRGIKIRFVYDELSKPEKSFYHGTGIISNLAHISQGDNTGTEVDKLMHNKFAIFDRKIVYTGSMNFSKTGFSGYDANDILIIKSAEVAGLYTEEFEQMLNKKFHSAKTINKTDNHFIISGTPIEIYFSPKYNTANAIIKHINNANKYIYVPTFLITHSAITEALINAHNRGVNVRIIMDAANVATTHIKYQQIRQKGIPLKIENYAGKLHSKTMIIDDEYLILGSMNFSNSGNKNNDENTIIIQDSRLTMYYRTFFEYLWKIIPDKYLKYNPPAESKDSIGSCTDGVDNNFDGKIDSEDIRCKQ